MVGTGSTSGPVARTTSQGVRIMSTGSEGRRDGGRQGRIPKNRARLFIVLAVVVILVVVFGYLLIVSQAGSN
jgi:hypothetical protein